MNKKKKKVLFLNMPNTLIDDSKAAKYIMERNTVSNVPYGLLSICSYLKKHSGEKADIKIFDINDEIDKAYRGEKIYSKANILNSVSDFIEDYKPDIVGISIMFNVSYIYLDVISELVKKHNKNTVVIVGGNMATSLYDEIAKKENIDSVCFGEGEIPFCQLLEADNFLQYLEVNSSFVTKKKLDSAFKPVNTMVQNLDEIPPIDFEFIDLSCYKGPMKRFFERDDKTQKEEPMTLVIYTSRGCPFNCCFCACHIVHGKKVRFMSKEKIISDVKLLIEKYKIKCLMVNDDNFLIDKNRAKAILEEFINLGLKVVFPSLLIRNIDEEIASLLKRAGVHNQLVSIESGSEYVLKNIIHKPLRKDQIFTAVENMRKVGITVDTNVVIGFPGETDAHRKETLDTIYEAGFNWSHFLIVLPVPGTSLYKECKENKYLVNDSNFYSPNLSVCNIRTPEYDPEHIQKQAYMMNLYANFVNNYNLRTGNYDECILHLGNILKSVPDHAFAYYGLMKAYEGKGDKKLAEFNKKRFKEITNNNSFWKDYAEYFGLIKN